MTEAIAEFVASLAILDVKVWLDGDTLRCAAPTEVLAPLLVEKLHRRRQELIEFLRASSAPAKHDDFDPHDPDFVLDPYPAYQRLREGSPVHRSPMGHWVLTRYQDVREALLNPALANAPAPYSWLHASNNAVSLGARVANSILPFMDGEAHARARRLIASTFSTQLRERPPDLKVIAAGVLRPFLTAGRLDIVGDFGRPYAAQSICSLMGLPVEDHQCIARWADEFLYLLTGVLSQEHRSEVEDSLREFHDYCSSALAKRIREPGDDLLSALIAAGDPAERLTDDQIVGACMLLVADGIENVASLIGTSVALFLEHAHELTDVRADPPRLKRAVTECIRYETPGQYIARVASADVVIAGQTIRKNESVLLVLGAANRDADVYAIPDLFDPARDEARHLSFGRGRHTCLGAQLVPLEIEAALDVIFGELPGLRLAKPAREWLMRPGHRWLQECQVAFKSD